MRGDRIRRVLRAVGLLTATVAAVAVYVIGGRDGGQEWQVPALVLVGVLVLVLHAATLPRLQVVAPATGAPAAPASQSRSPQSRSPYHLPEPGPAEWSYPATAVGTLSDVAAGLTEVVVPPSAFPDAGHAHGPVHAVLDMPPPLHTVLASPAGPPPTVPPPAVPPLPSVGAPPPPGAVPPPVDPTSPDSVQVDLTAAAGDPLVYRVLPGPPPPPDSRADQSAPGVDSPDGGPPPV